MFFKKKDNLGDYFIFGKYYGEPILWRCIAIDDNGPLMLSDKFISIKSYYTFKEGEKS